MVRKWKPGQQGMMFPRPSEPPQRHLRSAIPRCKDMVDRDTEVALLAKWPIRNKLLVGIGLLTVIVGALSTSGFLGVYAYRSLVRSLHNRAAELPLATELAQKVSDLRVSVPAPPSAGQTAIGQSAAGDAKPEFDLDFARDRFRTNFDAVQSAFEDYCNQLAQNDQDDMLIADRSSEQAVVASMKETIAEMADLAESSAWPLDAKRVERLNSRLDLAQSLAGKLPSFLHARIHDLVGRLRSLSNADYFDLADHHPGASDVRLARASVLSLGVSALASVAGRLANRGGRQFQPSHSTR